MHIQPRKDKKGHVTLYFAPLGSKEAREAGFLREDGRSRELMKVVDTEKGTVTIMVDWAAEQAAT